MSNNTWADNVLEPEPEDGDAGMTIIPPTPQEAVGVMPEPTPDPAPAAPTKKKITWQDFPLEDHVRAWMYPNIAPDSKLTLGKVGKNQYRANVYTPTKGGVVAKWHITASAHLNITLGPDGYIIVGEKNDLTNSKQKK